MTKLGQDYSECMHTRASPEIWLGEEPNVDTVQGTANTKANHPGVLRFRPLLTRSRMVGFCVYCSLHCINVWLLPKPYFR